MYVNCPGRFSLVESASFHGSEFWDEQRVLRLAIGDFYVALVERQVDFAVDMFLGGVYEGF